MVKEINKIPEKLMQPTKKARFLADMKEVVEKGYKVAELIPAEEDMNVKYPQNITEKYRWAARACKRPGISIVVSMRRDKEKKPHWYAEVYRHETP